MTEKMKRRAFLKKAGALSSLGIGVTASAGIASATHLGEQPEHVTITYDEDWLKQYQPALVFEKGTQDKLIGQFAWRATSTEYEEDVGVYWCSYTHQDGVSEYDSHLGDHEPLYVFVDSETGDVSRIIYSAYHWLAGRTTAPPLDATHPKMHVVKPWHHYYTTPAAGSFADLYKLGSQESLDDPNVTTTFESWLENGLEESLEPGTVVDPWIMKSRGDWWRDDVAGVSFNAIYVSVLLKLGLHEASQTDLQ